MDRWKLGCAARAAHAPAKHTLMSALCMLCTQRVVVFALRAAHTVRRAEGCFTFTCNNPVAHGSCQALPKPRAQHVAPACLHSLGKASATCGLPLRAHSSALRTTPAQVRLLPSGHRMHLTRTHTRRHAGARPRLRRRRPRTRDLPIQRRSSHRCQQQRSPDQAVSADLGRERLVGGGQVLVQAGGLHEAAIRRRRV